MKGMIEAWIETRCASPLVRNARDGSIMVLVPGGEFEMGDGKEGDCPKHRVWVDAFYIGVYCVTNAQWNEFAKATGRNDAKEVGKAKAWHPVMEVSWDDASAYAGWAGCELPTEAQWEKAARGVNGLIYPWGDEWDEGKCRNDKNRGSEQTAAVWSYPEGASGYGTYQQSGNVWEWCRDWYGEKVTSGVQRNPVGPKRGALRVFRGGSWEYGVASYFRGANRYGDGPARGGYVNQGFRLVRTAGS